METIGVLFTVLFWLVFIGFGIIFVRFIATAAKMLLGLIVLLLMPVILVGSGIWMILRPLYERLARSPLGGFEEEDAQATVASNPADARVVDGDTVVIRGERIRIAYIDAPEIGQVHLGTGADAGRVATATLRRFISEAQDSIEVIPIETDRYGRTVAMLRIGPYDVGLTMVKMGMAIANRDAPEAYKEAEAWAREKKVGLWRDGGFVPPDIHRIFAT